MSHATFSCWSWTCFLFISDLYLNTKMPIITIWLLPWTSWLFLLLRTKSWKNTQRLLYTVNDYLHSVNVWTRFVLFMSSTASACETGAKSRHRKGTFEVTWFKPFEVYVPHAHVACHSASAALGRWAAVLRQGTATLCSLVALRSHVSSPAAMWMGDATSW